MSEESRCPPLFIGGFFRSGTSLVRRLVNSHPNIHCPTEVKFFKDFFGDYLQDPLSHLRFFRSVRALGFSDEVLLTAFGQAYIELRYRAAEELGKNRWADKDPEHLRYLDCIGQIAPGFRLAICIRDPRDIMSSLVEVGFVKTVPQGLEARLALLTNYWGRGLRFCKENPSRCHIIEYERLVQDHQAVMANLFRFIGESVQLASFTQLAEPSKVIALEDPKIPQCTRIHDSSVGRWRHDLPGDMSDRIMVVAGDLWSQLRGFGDRTGTSGNV